jgi:hypothetical protein
MTPPTPMRPAWVVPTILVALFAVAVFVVRVVGQDVEQTAFPTRRVPEPSASAPATTESRPDYGLALSAAGVGPHRFGDPDAAVLEAMTDVLGPPTEDALEECGPGQQTRWVRWADLSIRLDDGQFVAFIEGIHYPPGPAPLGIPTTEGLVAGDPAARLFELYDRDSLTQVPAPGSAEQDAIQFEIADYGTQPLVVVVEGGAETGQVVAISAGTLCPDRPPAA